MYCHAAAASRAWASSLSPLSESPDLCPPADDSGQLLRLPYKRATPDGIALDDEKRARLIDLAPIAQTWIEELTFVETRCAEPILTHPLT